MTMLTERPEPFVSFPLTTKGKHAATISKDLNRMNTERSKLSIGNRRPKKQFVENPNSTVSVAKGASIEAELDELLNSVEDGDASPAVRLKSTDTTYNVTGDRVILIRRNPFAGNGEYEPADKHANEKSLRQWASAGILSQYPSEHRVFAERDLIRTINEKSRYDKKDSRNAWSKYATALARFQDETQHEFSPDSREYQKEEWTIANCEREVDMLHESSAMDRLARFTHALKDKIVTTPEGVSSARSAQLLAMLDSLPVSQAALIPSELRSELAVALTNMTGTSHLMLEKLDSVVIDWDQVEATETMFTWKRILWTASKVS